MEVAEEEDNASITESLEEVYPYRDFAQIGQVRLAFGVSYAVLALGALLLNSLVIATVVCERVPRSAVSILPDRYVIAVDVICTSTLSTVGQHSHLQFSG